jgi:hypothetical protein
MRARDKIDHVGSAPLIALSKLSPFMLYNQPMMNRYFRTEINGNAQDCDQLIKDLRNSQWDLYVDFQGYLIVSEGEWDKLEKLAKEHHCELDCLSQVQQAA